MGNHFELIHPFTPSACGVDENLVTTFYTGLFLSLSRLNRESYVTADIVFLSDKVEFYVINDENNLDWKFFPKSFSRFKSSNKFGKQWSWKLWKHLVVSRPAAVCLFISTGTFSKLLALTCFFLRIPYLILVGGWGVPGGWFQRLYFQFAKKVIVHTRKQANELKSRGFPHHNLVVMPIGVDTKLFSQKADNQYLNNTNQLLFVGRILPSKGVVETIETFHEVYKKFPNTKLRIIGPASDRDYFLEVTQRIRELDLESAIEILGKSIPNNNLPSFYQEADIFLFPTKSESLGIVMLESMSCGTPVVTLRNSGSTDEVIRHGIDGLVVDKTDLAEAISSLLENREKLRIMGQNSSRHVRRKFGFEVTHRELKKIMVSTLRGEIESKE
jgi:glycosyltransferase involved in cell wall biosynthesis